jgi:hypothetical protein
MSSCELSVQSVGVWRLLARSIDSPDFHFDYFPMVKYISNSTAEPEDSPRRRITPILGSGPGYAEREIPAAVGQCH